MKTDLDRFIDFFDQFHIKMIEVAFVENQKKLIYELDSPCVWYNYASCHFIFDENGKFLEMEIFS